MNSISQSPVQMARGGQALMKQSTNSDVCRVATYRGDRSKWSLVTLTFWLILQGREAPAVSFNCKLLAKDGDWNDGFRQ
jgi:hypothetical protein